MKTVKLHNIGPNPCYAFMLLSLFQYQTSSASDDLVHSKSNNPLTKLNDSLTVESKETFPYSVYVYETSTIKFKYTISSYSTLFANMPSCNLQVSIEKDNLVEILSDAAIKVSSPSNDFTVKLEGLLPGWSKLRFQLQRCFSETGVSSAQSRFENNIVTFDLEVTKTDNYMDYAFMFAVIGLVTSTNTCLGCTVDLNVVTRVLKRPLAPLVGLVSQFFAMPLIGYFVVTQIDLDPDLALGLFALGCAPGGAASNAYCHLLDGDVSLSITMTLISTMAALGFLPLWMFTLGQRITEGANIDIPFDRIVLSLVGIIFPVVVGLYLQNNHPKASRLLIKSIEYQMFVFLFILLTIGIYTNRYIFYLLTMKLLLAAALLPYIGFAVGGGFVFALGMDKQSIITVGLETGIQNVAIPIFLLKLSLKGPSESTAIIPAVASSVLTPLPLIIALIVKYSNQWYTTRNIQNDQENHVHHSQIVVDPSQSVSANDTNPSTDTNPPIQNNESSEDRPVDIHSDAV